MVNAPAYVGVLALVFGDSGASTMLAARGFGLAGRAAACTLGECNGGMLNCSWSRSLALAPTSAIGEYDDRHPTADRP